MSQSTLSRTDRTTTYGQDSALDEEIAVSLVRKIAEKRGEKPTETSVRLHDHVDPDGLNRLLSHARTSENAAWEFELTVEGSTVTISSDGSVTVA